MSKGAQPICNAQDELAYFAAPPFTARGETGSRPAAVGARLRQHLHALRRHPQFVSGPWSMYLGSFITAKGWVGSLII
jgi:hypothetical protein